MEMPLLSRRSLAVVAVMEKKQMTRQSNAKNTTPCIPQVKSKGHTCSKHTSEERSPSGL